MRRRMMLEQGRSLPPPIQVIPNSDILNISIDGIEVTKLNNGYILNGTATRTAVPETVRAYSIHFDTPRTIAIIGCSGGGSGRYALYDGMDFRSSENIYTNVSYLYTVYFLIYGGITVNNLKVLPQVVDLTSTYGAGSEPTTIEQFRADYPDEYYPYNPL